MIDKAKFKKDLALVRKNAPLVHNITNYVAMNNSANALLAIGASPVMIHGQEEAADMAAIAGALVLNIGTIEGYWLKAMILAGESARAHKHPVVLDPVGIGATPYRAVACKEIIEKCAPAVIRGNASEIIALVKTGAKTKGVDSTDSSDDAVDSAKILAKNTGAVVVVSGATDYITDGTRVECVKNGNPLMARVTAMGCTASAIVGAFVAVNPDAFDASVHAMAAMGICGEAAAEKAEGNGTMQLYFLDKMCALDDAMIDKYLKV